MMRKNGGPGNMHFFKPMLPGFSKKLAIPTAFVREIVKERCNVRTSTLVNPNGKSWRVDVYEDHKKDYMYFSGNGWLRFVRAHKLGVGYFVVFCYKGNMVFKFRVYDLSACEITSYASSDAPRENFYNNKKKTNNENEKKKMKEKITVINVEEDEENFEDDDGDEVTESIEKRKKQQLKKISEVKFEKENEDYEIEKDLKGTIDEKKMTKKKKKISEVKIEGEHDELRLKRRRKSSRDKIEESDNKSTYKVRMNPRYHERIQRNNGSTTGTKPKFEATVWPCNLSSPYMNIPVEFSDTNGLTEHNELTLMDPKGRLWQVRVMHRRTRFGGSRNTSSMHTGWVKFAAANKLEVGDKCIFKLGSENKNGRLLMKVSIRKKAVC
ncbi:B3 domain-containing protein Os03g0212300-like [Asparagus officinalis]|uniref:B3 domain-containing protein Os03g0212300-like n=1 Tax=Asparagus officinalis TaxID=4686 RepID=UPI00098E712A|nr:B3 domain-containing protein Os03g0212300-like [Asparagus officinalis]